MTATLTYGRIHNALRSTAGVLQTVPMNVRVLVALHERGGAATTDELTADLHANATAVRRAAGELYVRGWARGMGVDGGPRREGVRSRLELSAEGECVARSFFAHLEGTAAS